MLLLLGGEIVWKHSSVFVRAHIPTYDLGNRESAHHFTFSFGKTIKGKSIKVGTK
jgi:hypothetical protein